MFDIGWTEMLVIAVVMIVVVGPKDLPKMLRTFGKTTAKLRSMAGDFQKQFNEALKEAELDDVKKQVTDVKNQMADIGRIDPMADLKKDLTKTRTDIQANLAKPADPELGQITADKGPDEPAPVAEVAKSDPPAAVPEAVAAAVGDAKP